MTTNNTHPEHSDVETTVAEHFSASETHTTPAGEQSAPLQDASIDEDEPVEASLMEVQREPAQETQTDEPLEASLLQAQHEMLPEATGNAVASEAEHKGHKPDHDTAIPAVQEQVAPFAEAVEIPVVDVQAVTEEGTGEATEPAQSSQDTSSFTYTQDVPQQAEDVRPFTDFIEEFRQAEARFNSSLQAYEAEPFTNTIDNTGAESAPNAETQFIAPAEAIAMTGTQMNATPTFEEPGAPVESEDAPVPTPPEAPTPSVRPVSPLLRPAARLRIPRHGHGIGRQREEVPAEKVTQSGATKEEFKPETASNVAPAAPPAAEPARPARRYRFDRPAGAAAIPSGSTATPNQQQFRPEDAKETPYRNTVSQSVRTENGHTSNGQTVEREAQPSQAQAPKQPTGSIQSFEQQQATQNAPKQSVVQEPADTESNNTTTPPATTPAVEHGRRRHGQDRQKGKEQSTPIVPMTPAAPAPVADAVPAVPESVTPSKKEEVESEELPPLEYSEIQKANSRRRRRRQTTAASTAPAPKTAAETPVTSVVPMPTPTPTPGVVIPRPPAAQGIPANQYTITSGYTVSQMNQDGTGPGPFMGPDPSPAHGSIAAQNVRSIRTDAQRTPAYPVRTTEATSASVHQLANIVSQAVQTQTDRMVAELRRANQAPTNISVSLPPFPSNERVGVFVDVANLLYSARTLRMTVDFGKLLDFLRGNRRLVRAHAYCPTSPQPGDEQMFLQAVKGLGYRITTKNYKTFSSGAKKADLDLDLCIDVVRLVDGKAVDCIVLVSGDSDFMPMLDYCSDHGVRVEVAAFDEAMSGTLRQSCDLFINLGMLEEIRA